ncbi:hypothetical protein V865_000477 [Kwoniella europaea PYCC6329]|uniref:Uncharacterized protein n=1 Tax=Kwoniella europaea PYCC6329 TaxID=1423913 RepID=A0AAX4KAA6_9TREE
MPDPGYHPSHVSHPTSSSISTSISTAGGLRKRIVMNPPPSFIQYLESIAPPAPPPESNGPMMINPNRQAVLLSPNFGSTEVHGNLQPTMDQSSNVDVDSTDNTPSADEGDIDDGQVVLKGDKVVLVAPTQTSSPTITPTSTPMVIEMVSSVVDSTGIASSAITSVATATLASSSFSMTGSIISTSTAVTVTSTLATTSNGISLSTTSTAISTISTSSTSPSQSSTDKSSPTSDHHPPSAGIIFLIILLCLAIFIALASLLRYLVKSRRLPCLGRSRSDEDDDDGLSDLVRGFDTPRTLGGGGYNPYLHASTYPHLSDVDDNQEKSELERRSSLFAHQSTINANGRSPFLHTESQSNSPIGYNGNMDIPNLPIPPPTAHGMGTSTLPHHLLGETGPLEVRNAVPGEMDEHENAHEHEHEHAQDETEVEGIDGLVGLGLGQGSPRFLGVNGNGLPVPWSTPLPPRPSSIDSFDNHQLDRNLHPNPFGSSSTSSAAHAPPLGFPSPSLSHDSLSLPQRSATWASNLRNTLYNAISAARVPTVGSNALGQPGMGDEDKFTRTVSVGNIYRNASSRRKAIPSFDLEKGLKVVDEKDDIDDRMKSDDLSSTLVIPRRPAGERFKGYYSRSKSSMTTTSSSADGDEGEDEEEMRPPTRMAGGARAAGARTGSFVIV